MQITRELQTAAAAIKLLSEPITVAVVANGPGFVAQGKEQDYTAGGITRHEALARWRFGFVASIILQLEHKTLEYGPCPPDVWSSFVLDPSVELFAVQYDGRPLIK